MQPNETWGAGPYADDAEDAGTWGAGPYGEDDEDSGMPLGAGPYAEEISK